MTKFNLSRYRELLAKQDSFPKDPHELFKDPMLNELLDLKSEVINQVKYNQRNRYFAFIQTYLDDTINIYTFQGDFIEMYLQDLAKSTKILENFEELSTFWIDLESNSFSPLIKKIYQICLYALEFEYEEEALAEDKFRDLIEKIFPQLEKYCKKS